MRIRKEETNMNGKNNFRNAPEGADASPGGGGIR